jgi:hypothetical protein
LGSSKLGSRINGSRLPWSLIDRRSQRALCVTLKFKENEGKALLIQDPYLFSREIDYVPRAQADMGCKMWQGYSRYATRVRIGRSDDVLQAVHDEERNPVTLMQVQKGRNLGFGR